MKKKRKTAFFIVLAIAVLAVCAAFFSCDREYAPFEPDTAAIIRSGAAFQKVLRRSAQAESARERAVLELSGADVDAILAVLQSPMNPLLEKIPHNSHGLFFRLVREGNTLKFSGVRPLPGRLLFCGGSLAAEPKITPEKVQLAVSSARWGACPLPRAFVSSRLNRRGKTFLESQTGKLFRAAVVSFEVLPNGKWRIVYRPFLMRKLLNSAVLRGL